MFHDAIRLASDNWYLLLGAFAAVALPLWLARLLRGWRAPRVRTLRDKVALSTESIDIDQLINWLPQDSGGERRRALRRTGQPTDIRIAISPTDKAIDKGLVLDRATGGLCFAIEKPLREGEVLFLRAAGAAPELPWVAVIVRHCRDCGEYFLIGCQFKESLSLTARLQFG
jgi:hypothetical protein